MLEIPIRPYHDSRVQLGEGAGEAILAGLADLVEQAWKMVESE